METKELKVLRYETLTPGESTALEPCWDINLPVCSPQARVLRVERDGRVLLLDCGVPTPECDLELGTARWVDVHWIQLRAVLHFDTRVIVLPQAPGRYLGCITNAIGLWTVFERRRLPPTSAPPGKPSAPPRTGRSATGSDPF